MPVMTGLDFVRKLCELLNIAPGRPVLSIRVEAHAREVPKVHLTLVPSGTEALAIMEAASKAEPVVVDEPQYVPLENMLNPPSPERRKRRRQEVRDFLLRQKEEAILLMDWPRAIQFRDAADMIRMLDERETV